MNAFVCVLVSLYLSGSWITEKYECDQLGCIPSAPELPCPDYSTATFDSPAAGLYPIRLRDYQDAVQIYISCALAMTADLTTLSPMPNLVGFYSECATNGYYQMLAGATASYPYLADEDRAEVDKIIGSSNSAALSASASVSAQESLSDSISYSASISASASESVSQSHEEASASAEISRQSASVSASLERDEL